MYFVVQAPAQHLEQAFVAVDGAQRVVGVCDQQAPHRDAPPRRLCRRGVQLLPQAAAAIAATAAGLGELDGQRVHAALGLQHRHTAV